MDNSGINHSDIVMMSDPSDMGGLEVQGKEGQDVEQPPAEGAGLKSAEASEDGERGDSKSEYLRDKSDGMELFDFLQDDAREGNERGDADEETASGSRKKLHGSDDSNECESETEGERKGSEKYHGLARLLTMMEDYRPVIPDAVTDYYLMRSGFECSDVRVKRLLALAAQRFISNIAEGAMQYYLMHSKGSESKDRKSAMKSKVKVLEMEDLSLSLADHGINVKRQEYYL